MTVSTGRLLALVAVVIFVLTAFGVQVSDFGTPRMVALGLAVGLASFVVP